jgi:hypothetical protein
MDFVYMVINKLDPFLRVINTVSLVLIVILIKQLINKKK